MNSFKLKGNYDHQMHFGSETNSILIGFASEQLMLLPVVLSLCPCMPW